MTIYRIVLLLLGGVAAGAPLPLVQDGKSEYVICLASGASAAERHAADELQAFLLEMSGARLPIRSGADCSGERVIRLDRAEQEEGLGDEGFRLKTVGRRLEITGGGKRGTLYGVYTLLDSLGCRWFTRDVSRIPRRKTILVGPLKGTRRPAFEYREPYFRESLDRNWAARNRMNGASMKLNASTGGKISYYPFVHSFYKMIPPEKYFGGHPEYFSLIDGKRRWQGGQLCLTNPELLKESVARVMEWIAERPDATIVSVSQNDWMGWCECDNCRRVEREEGGAHSGPLLRFVNALAEEVEKRYPDKLIDTLAYWYTEEAPAKTRPRRNVRIRLCPIGMC